MAFPVPAEAIEGSTNTAGTNHVITHPTVVAGELWILILDKGSTAATVNAHALWTELLDENLANGLYIAYRWTDGTEGASSTIVTSANTRDAHITYRITGAENPATQAPQIGTTSSGTSATPDPPASATPGSTKDYLFITFYGAAGEEADDDTWSDTPPTNYTPSPPRQKSCGTAGTNLGGLIAAAERQLNTGAAENPGTFAKDVSAAWRAQTIMVHPTAATAFEETVNDTLSISDAVSLLVQKAIADTATPSDAQALEVQMVIADPLAIADAQALERLVNIEVDDALAIADAAPTIETGKEALVDDTLGVSDALSLIVEMGVADALAITDALAVVAELTLADALAIADSIAAQRGLEVFIDDTLGGGAGPPGATVAPVLVWIDGRLALKVGGRFYIRV